MLKNKNILYIVHNYNTFQKDSIEEAAKYFKKVYVLVRYKPISKIAKFIPINWIKKFEDSNVIDSRDVPENIEIIRTPVWYSPHGIFNKLLGGAHYRAVDKVIKDRAINFDIIHSHFLWSSGYVGMKVKEKYKKPLVVTGHGYDVYEIPFKSDSWQKKAITILKNTEQLIVVSRYNEKVFEKLCKGCNTNLVSNGFNDKLFQKMNKIEARRKLALPKNKKILLTVGNLEKIKGYNILVKALKIVKEKEPNFICFHIGVGTQEKKIKGLLKRYGLEGNLKLLGRKPHNELRNWYGSCDFFVSSSLFEGNPTVMFEALGCGRPFVGTKVGGIPDVITSDEYGKLSEPGDAEQLAENILFGLNKTWDNERISKYAKCYSWENIVKIIIKIYERIL